MLIKFNSFTSIRGGLIASNIYLLNGVIFDEYLKGNSSTHQDQQPSEKYLLYYEGISGLKIKILYREPNCIF